MQNEEVFPDLVAEAAAAAIPAACWNIAMAAGLDTPHGNLPPEELNAPLSCCCLYSWRLAMVAPVDRLLVGEKIGAIDEAEVTALDCILSIGVGRIERLECGDNNGGGGNSSEVKGHEESLCVDKSWGREEMLLLMEVGRLKSLVLSTELSEPDMMAEGLCNEGWGRQPAAAAAACAAKAEAAKLLTPPSRDVMKAECCFSGVVTGVTAEAPLLGEESNPTGDIGGGATPVDCGLSLAERGCGPPLFAFTTHFRMCFSNVEATLNGISQKRHLNISFPMRPWVRMCLVNFELCAQA